MGSVPEANWASPPTAFGPGVRVAVIGAGVSGLCTGAHLLKQGANVTVFERSPVSSGVWHFDPRVDAGSVEYPSKAASAGDYTTSVPGQFLPHTSRASQQHPLDTPDRDALDVAFAPPGPCYSGLKNNVPTTLLYSSLRSWPDGTADNVSHWEVERYLQDLGADYGLDDVILYNTRVEEAKKSIDGKRWLLRTITLLAERGEPQVVERTWDFYAVVACSGHYNLPRVPAIPGLDEWKAAFHDRIIHTKEYRNPEPFRNKNVLVIGGGTSSLDVCRELSEAANRIYQSTRGGRFDHSTTVLPSSVKRVGEVSKFVLNPAATKTADSIPGQIVLKDGSVFADIHHVIIATGYITSFPFLAQFHRDELLIDDATTEVLVTSEGNMVHNLHKDIFYIEDPTLSFIGIPYYVSTFTLFDFQAQVVARVLTGKTRLPTRPAMRREYEYKVVARGRGRNFHSLADEGAEVAHVKDLVDNVNAGTTDSKIELMQGHTQSWLDTHFAHKAKKKALGHVKSYLLEGSR